MPSLHRIYENAPDVIQVPEELRHRRVEVILRSLDEPVRKERRAAPRFHIADVEEVEIPSREERNARW